jgi:hypothetical protein
MTTAKSQTDLGPRTPTVGPVLRMALMVSLVVGALAIGLAAVVDGAAAALGAAIGVAIVVGFFGFGTVLVGLVATMAPKASLPIALLTYALQVAVVGGVFVALSRSGALDGDVDGRWLALTVIVGTFAWMLTQIVTTTRTRRPVYDLPPGGASGGAR